MNEKKAITPAYRIETNRLVIRCWQPSDAQMLKDAMDISLDHLHPFFPLSKGEPLPLDQRIEKLRKARGQFDLDQYYTYGVFNLSEDRVIGWTSLTYLSQTLSLWIHSLTGSNELYERWFGNVLKFGIWVRVDESKKGYGTECIGALVKIAFEIHQAERVIYQHEKANTGSAAITGKLGFTKTDLRAWYKPKNDRISTVLQKEDYPMSPAAHMEIKAYDAFGRVIL